MRFLLLRAIGHCPDTGLLTSGFPQRQHTIVALVRTRDRTEVIQRLFRALMQSRTESRGVYCEGRETHVSNLSGFFHTFDRGNDRRLRGRFSAEGSSYDYRRFAGQCSGGLSGSEDPSLRSGLRQQRNRSRQWKSSDHDLSE